MSRGLSAVFTRNKIRKGAVLNRLSYSLYSPEQRRICNGVNSARRFCCFFNKNANGTDRASIILDEFSGKKYLYKEERGTR
jgi:hypothetical protein